MTNSVYIHIPFCTSICTYCAFSKFYKNKVHEYLDSLEKEIKIRYQNETIKTLYIGGGSPSCLNLDELKHLFKILKIFKLDKDIEFTFEVNPDDLTKEKLVFLKNNKVNRISMGVESTISKNLKYLGRNHDFKLVKNMIKLIKEIGINNINIDLIYALKNQSLKDLEIDLKNILSLDINHISTYSLMIEPHTILGINKEKSIDEDMDYLMYQKIINTLKENGFNHYEISNFAKEGYASRHNLVYWNNDYYYGFGISSASYLKNKRIKNTSSLKAYLNGNYIKEVENLTKKDIISYALILGFRKIKGINKQEFFKRYGVNILDLYNIRDLIKEKKLSEDNNNIFISYDKIYIENSILMNFVGD